LRSSARALFRDLPAAYAANQKLSFSGAISLLPTLRVTFPLCGGPVFVFILTVVMTAVILLFAVANSAAFLLVATWLASSAEEIENTHQSSPKVYKELRVQIID
jgi:hypothetical protein